MTREPKSVLDLQKLFPDEQACLDYIEAQRWNGKPRCPRCESEKVSKFTTGKRAGKLWWCAGCRQQFTVKIGTIFEDSPIKLEKWFLAIYICSAHKKGIAARQLAKDIDVQIKTAWFMGHRIRTMMANGSMEKQLSGTVEIDETYIGGKEENKHTDKRTKGTQGRSTKTKAAVMGLLERGGEVTSFPVENVKTDTLQEQVWVNVKKGAKVMADELPSYNGLERRFKVERVNHSAKEYVRGMAHTNGIENFWSLLKRGIVGIYHNVSREHLHRYCDEFNYRYNTRKLTDGERFAMVLGNADGRLTYSELTGK